MTKRIVLVHGAGHGGWCWQRLTPLLEERGYDVLAPDLPGLGDDDTSPAEVTFRSGVERVVQVLAGSREPALLVGHSLGGATVTQAAEECPEMVARLVYLTAFLPLDGESPADLVAGSSSTMEAVEVDEVGGTYQFKADLAPDVLYNHCDPATTGWAAGRLRPQPSAPLGSPVRVSPGRWGSVPKVYVVCTDDHALPCAVQEFLCDRVPGIPRRYIDSDHSPFLSHPDQLAVLLHEEAQGNG